MAKYSFDFKGKIVLDYLAGKDILKGFAKTNGVTGKEQVRKWIKNYQTFGDSGLMHSRKQEKYTFEYKLHVVELYLTSDVSYQDLALQEGIHNPAQICKWVNDFQIAGSDALRPKKNGCKKLLDLSKSKKKEIHVETVPAHTIAEHIKQLEDELLKLRIENTYLKERRRLHSEEEALLKKQ